MYTDYLILGAAALLILLLLISIIKKAVKLAIGIVIIFIAFSFYDIAVKGVSPVDEINGYKTNISYSIAIADYTGKIQKSVSALKLALESKNLDDSTKSKIKAENENLHKYQAEINALKHTEKLNFFHQQYCSYVNNILGASDTALKVTYTSGASITNIQKYINEAGAVFQSLSQLKISDSIK